VEEFACPRLFEWAKSGYVNKVFNWLKAKINGKDIDAKGIKCKTQIEIVSHLASGCGELTQLEYKKRHDRIGLRIY